MNENRNDLEYAPILAAISRKEETLFLFLAKEKIEPNELISKIKNYPDTTEEHIIWIEQLIFEKNIIDYTKKSITAKP